MAVNPTDPLGAGAESVAASHRRERERVAPTLTDLAHAARAVLGVAVELPRYVAERVLPLPRTSRPHARGLRLVHPESRPEHPGDLERIATRARALAGEAVGRVMDVVVPPMARAVLARLDVPALVAEFVDIGRIVDLVDIDAVAGRLDLAPLIDRVDVEAVVAKVDLDAIVDRLDIDRVLDRLDLDAIVGRVDLDAAVARVHIDEVLARVDLDDVVRRVDLDAAVDRVDLDRIIDRADIVGIARYVIDAIDLPAVIRNSTGSVTAEMVRGVRDQGAGADRAVERLVDRVLRRHAERGGGAGTPLPDGVTEADGSDHDRR